MSRLRVLAASALLACVLPLGQAVVAAGPADAAPAGKAECRTQSVPVSTRSATAVFTGTVTASDGQPRTDGLAGQVFTQQVSVQRVYVGNVTSDAVSVQTDKVPKQCTLGRLVTGSTYVFFVTGDGDPWLAAGGGGTSVSSPDLVAEVEALRGAGRAPVAPAKEAASYSPVDVSKQTSLSRLAAPGAALVIVGLLGLLVVGRLGRRSA